MIRDEEINQKARELALDWNVGRGNEFYYRFDKLVDIARWADRNQPNPWISVDERLPVCMNENQYYRYTDNILVCIQTNLEELYKVAMFKKEKSSGREFFQIERPFDFDERVTHWMQIPQIEKGGNV